MSDKIYLGDGVYVNYDGYCLCLTTENGISVTNTIVLEPKAYNALVSYVDLLDRRRRLWEK